MEGKETYILALDQGTTSSRAILFDKAGEIVAVAQREFKQYFPKPGWVEHDAKEIWTSQATVAMEVLTQTGITPSQIAGIGITNQRETTVVWDRSSGRPLHKAIVWQDRRTADYCNQLLKEGKGELINKKTGLIIDSYFSATKVRWILENVDGAREKADAGELCFGTIDSWLVYNLTSGKHHLTDISNASRTMLFNIVEKKWDEELLDLFGIPMSMMPEVKSSSEVYCTTAGDVFSAKIPIAGIAGDQQAALFGQLCLKDGMAKTTYGTGCFLVMNTGEQPVFSSNKLLTTVAWEIAGKTTYALEGSVFIGGAAIQWLRDQLELFKNAEESEDLAAQLEDNEGVYFVPALTGLGAPHWDANARGAFFGITRGTGKAHFARAALESIAYQVKDVLSSMERDRGEETQEMRVDGGATANDLLMQFQADLVRCAILRPAILETTALGAAYLAGLAVGFWKNTDELESLWKSDSKFEPKMDEEKADALLKYWQKAVKRASHWIED
ncbi:glycerol kinase GlpK [Litoribacter alkaliphilus]|uniref:Glycerol kinase n=1 Tax=Litoribacter ruber TaxID=702568 RepID=A0AAP2G3H0_9BACT|nr:glycerol kinase GlpK [Litoribacter alkaliphilus]MBS9522488.1 glycerol kinase GlpK [Litoribacter alkaliphilus]